MSKISDSVTIMLVAVCVFFAAMTTPYAAMYGINSDVSTLKYALMLQGIYINHSMNFAVFMIFNKRYRAEVKHIFHLRSSKGGERTLTCSLHSKVSNNAGAKTQRELKQGLLMNDLN